MASLRAWLARVASLVHSKYGDRELDEEIRHHTEMLVEHLVSEGWSPEAARLEARRQLGSVAHASETYRAQRGLPRLEYFLTDLKHSIRGLRRAPAFTLVATLTLALGIGATTLVFTVVYGVLLRPLPYPHADRIVEIVQLVPSKSGAPHRGGLENDQLYAWREHSQTLTNVGRYGSTSMTFATSAEPVRLYGGTLSPTSFDGLGIQPLIGRTFRADEELPGHERVVILSERTWNRYYGGDRQLIDRTITMSGQPYRVIGVMPDRFRFPSVTETSMVRDPSGRVDTAPEFWLPANLAARRTAPSQGFSLGPAIGFLSDGVTIEQATAEANSLGATLPNGDRPTIELVSLQDEMTRATRPVLLLFQAGVAFVLLIAAINVINLMLTRATHRQRELAIRVALGASGPQIARRVMAEALVIAVAGGALGWVFVLGAFPLLKSLPPTIIPRVTDIRLDVPLLVFTSAVSLGVGVIIGLFVTVRVMRAKPWLWMREIASSGAAVSFGRNRPSNVLVVAEIAAAMLLLVGAGLLLNSFARLTAISPGFDPTPLMTFKVGLPASRYPKWAQQQSFSTQLRQRIQSLPGVEDVALGTSLPFQPSMIGWPIKIGNEERKGEAIFRFVDPGFFRAMGIPVQQGREFDERDRTGSTPVVVVNAAFARKFFGEANPIGQSIQFQSSGPLDIIGVVGDTKSEGHLTEEVDPEITLPYQQEPKFSGGSATLAGALRLNGDRAAVLPNLRSIVKDLDPTLAVYATTSMTDVLGNSYVESRLYTLTASVFGSVAVLLAIIGLYGVLAYSVVTRTREFGVRMALGADEKRLVRVVVREGLGLALIGLTIGLAGSLMVSQLLTKLLFGVQPRDPLTLAGTAALFMVIAALASYIPARRATQISPVIALRAE